MPLLLYFIWFAGVFGVFSSDRRQEYMYTVNILFHKLQDMQVQKSTESDSVFIATRYRGTFESEWTPDVYEPIDSSHQPSLCSVRDSDIFTNLWITMMLLEAYEYGKAPKPTEVQLGLSIDAIADFRNRTLGILNPRMTMWSHKYNAGPKTWIRGPVNLRRLMESMTNIDREPVNRERNRGDLPIIIKHLIMSQKTFDVPSDFESTFMNLGLGSLLRSMERDSFGRYDTWTSHFGDVMSLMSVLKHLAYRPFSSNEQTNLVDTKTYFYLRTYLEAAKEENKDVLLIPTWILDGERRGTAFSSRHLKTIDVTTSASVLFGLTNMILTGMVSFDVLDDPDVEKIYRNTSSMLTFQIRSNFSGRPDIALLYHPSEFQFYWSVARTLSILRRHINRHGLLHEALVAIMLELKEVLQGYCTTRILSAATRVGPDQVYFQDYRTKRETRVFTTAMAMNTLLSSWTVLDEGSGYLVWEEYTPVDIREVMTRAVTWLNRHILGEKYRPGNELLSWPRRDTLLNPYPANTCLHENGSLSQITPRYPCNDPLTAAVQGVVSAEWYVSQMTDGKPAGTGDSNDGSVEERLVWSSRAFTYASSMLALSRHQNSIDYDVAYRRP